jgi:phage repressor protein C with HTH and peptisase S24 domain
MLKSESDKIIKVHRIHSPFYREKNGESLVPLYNIDAAANLKTIFDNKHQNIINTIRIPDLPKCDGAIYIRGDSMYPLLKSGDIVIYKEIADFENLIFGEMYLIDFTINDDDFLVVKYVKRSNIKGYIQLISYNSHHDPMDIPVKGCIRAMALIKASVRINTMM